MEEMRIQAISYKPTLKVKDSHKHVNSKPHTQVRAMTRSTECIPGGRCLMLVKMLTKTAVGPSSRASICPLSLPCPKSTEASVLALSSIILILELWPLSNFSHLACNDRCWYCSGSFNRGEESDKCCAGFGSSGISLAKYRVTSIQNVRNTCM